MKKHTILLTLLPALLITACAGGDYRSISREKLDSTSEPTNPSASTDGSTASAEEEPYLHNLKKEDYKSFYKYYFARLNKFKSYKTATLGETKAVIVTQPIEATVIKGEYSYMTNISHSAFADTEHKAYYHNGKAVYKDYGEDDYHVSTLDEYLDKYGFYPLENSIEGYIVKEEYMDFITIKKNKDDDNYVVDFDLDPEKSTPNVKLQMKAFGGLDNFPAFTKVSLTLTLKDDYTPVKIVASTNYNVTKGIPAACSQNYTVTFSNFDEEILPPDLEAIKPLFN